MSFDCETKNEIEKPDFLNLKAWRTKYGFVTPEWEMYADAWVIKLGVAMIIAYAAGVLSGYGLFVVR